MDGESKRIELLKQVKAAHDNVTEQWESAKELVKSLKQRRDDLGREMLRLVDGDVQLTLDLDTGEIKEAK